MWNKHIQSPSKDINRCRLALVVNIINVQVIGLGTWAKPCTRAWKNDVWQHASHYWPTLLNKGFVIISLVYTARGYSLSINKIQTSVNLFLFAFWDTVLISFGILIANKLISRLFLPDEQWFYVAQLGQPHKFPCSMNHAIYTHHWTHTLYTYHHTCADKHSEHYLHIKPSGALFENESFSGFLKAKLFECR